MKFTNLFLSYYITSHHNTSYHIICVYHVIRLHTNQIGTGGVQALADCLERNSVMYGLVRVRVTETTTGGSRGNGNGSEKFCCVKWAPEDGSADHTTPELQVKITIPCCMYETTLTRTGRGRPVGHRFSSMPAVCFPPSAPSAHRHPAAATTPDYSST